LKRFFQSEAGAAVCWVVLSMLMAATLAPWLYQAGMWLADLAKTQDLPGIFEWLGSACERANFSRFFSRALIISAFVLIPLLAWRIRAIRQGETGTMVGLSAMPWKMAVAQVLLGCVIAGGLLWIGGMILEWFGAFVQKPDPPSAGKFLRRVVMSAVAVPLLEEWLFRGMLLGLWLKFSKPLTACIGTSLFFAFIHFLKPPDGVILSDPASALAGFELLGKVLLHFTDPHFFITEFATLFLVGMILAFARLRTGALWFSIGLHAGWIIAFKGFVLLHRPVLEHPFYPWGVGQTLQSGIFPLLALGLTAAVCRYTLLGFDNYRMTNR
jgi:uncharacterized protein